MALWFTLIVTLFLIIVFFFSILFSPRFRKDLLAGKGQTKVFGILSVSGATIVVVQGLLIGTAVFVSLKIGTVSIPFHFPQFWAHPAETAIRDFFSSLNSAIAENSGFDKCWKFLTKSRQEKTMSEFRDCKFPEDFGKLYASAGHHDLLSIVKMDDGPDVRLRTYFVVFRVREKHPLNPLFKHFDQPTQSTFEEALDFAAKEGTNAIRESLRANFDIGAAARRIGISEAALLDRIISDNVKRNFANRVIGLRLLTEIGTSYVLPMKPAPLFVDKEGFLSHYDVYEGDKITVVEKDGVWKLDRISMVSLHAISILR